MRIDIKNRRPTNYYNTTKNVISKRPRQSDLKWGTSSRNTVERTQRHKLRGGPFLCPRTQHLALDHHWTRILRLVVPTPVAEVVLYVSWDIVRRVRRRVDALIKQHATSSRLLFAFLEGLIGGKRANIGLKPCWRFWTHLLTSLLDLGLKRAEHGLISGIFPLLLSHFSIFPRHIHKMLFCTQYL